MYPNTHERTALSAPAPSKKGTEPFSCENFVFLARKYIEIPAKIIPMGRWTIRGWNLPIKIIQSDTSVVWSIIKSCVIYMDKLH
jgi:hypothetical protein